MKQIYRERNKKVTDKYFIFFVVVFKLIGNNRFNKMKDRDRHIHVAFKST